MNKSLDDVSDSTIKLMAKGARQRVVAWFMKHFPPAPMPLDYHARIAPPFLATPTTPGDAVLSAVSAPAPRQRTSFESDTTRLHSLRLPNLTPEVAAFIHDALLDAAIQKSVTGSTPLSHKANNYIDDLLDRLKELT
jgi:hypothetical protein